MPPRLFWSVAGVDLVDDFDFAFLTHIIFSMVSQLLRYLLELLKKFRQVLQNDSGIKHKSQ